MARPYVVIDLETCLDGDRKGIFRNPPIKRTPEDPSRNPIRNVELGTSAHLDSARNAALVRKNHSMAISSGRRGPDGRRNGHKRPTKSRSPKDNKRKRPTRSKSTNRGRVGRDDQRGAGARVIVSAKYAGQTDPKNAILR